MKKQLATFLFIFMGIKSLLMGHSFELNTSYDYFRGMPDGSWNGNNGALIGANSDICLDCIDLQVGGSYGLYNWDGRGNVVFANPKKLEQIGFVTGGITTSFCQWGGEWGLGLVYDRMFSENFGIYCLNPSIDQLRGQIGYALGCDEIGVWGTLDLCRSNKIALGIPIDFKAIGQVNFFWRHFFANNSQVMLWGGIPYQNSLMFPDKPAGRFTAGFSFRVPLNQRLFLDGNGSYMAARESPGVIQSRNYGANICVGLTYCFSDNPSCDSPYMPIANHSNFFVDTNINQ